MTCPFCEEAKTLCIQTHHSGDPRCPDRFQALNATYRRRECQGCGKRVSTVELAAPILDDLLKLATPKGGG